MGYILFFSVVLLMICSGQNTSDHYQPPPKEAVAPLLSPQEEHQLNQVEAAAEKATARRKELQAPYQEALNTELNALLTYSNSIRFVERGKCGKNEALAKPKKEWVCVALNPKAPAQSPAQ